MNPNEIPRNNAKDKVIIVKDGRWYEAVGARPGAMRDPTHVWLDGCTRVGVDRSAELRIREVTRPEPRSKPAYGWKIVREYADGAVAPSVSGHPQGGILYPTKEIAVEFCIERIGLDIGAADGVYDPDLWNGLSWPEHAKSIREVLLAGGRYSYCGLTWRVQEERA